MIEHPVGQYVIDIVRGRLLIEIQTRGFSSMKRKLESLISLGHQVRIVYPIAVDKWIVKVDNDGTILDRRLSPKHGQTSDLFSEMVSFPELLGSPGLEVEVVLTNQEEYRTYSPGKAWRRKGWVVMERRLLDVIDTKRITTRDQTLELLPSPMPSPFTTVDISNTGGLPVRLAGQMAYCLRKAGLIEMVGKRGSAYLYKIA